jgi:hypothetical protein
MSGSGVSWTNTEVALPNPSVVIQQAKFSIACPSDSSCVVAGQYDGGTDLLQSVMLTGSGTSWTLTPAQSPSSAAGFNDSLNSVSCGSDSSCVAVGTYAHIDGVGPDYGQMQSWQGTAWTDSQAATPANAWSGSQVFLNSVACTAASSCTAVGWYEDSAGSYQGLLLTESGS